MGMKLLKMKECSYTQHVPGLGLFEPDEFTEVSEELIKAYESKTDTKVSKRFEVKTPVAKEDTTAKQGGES